MQLHLNKVAFQKRIFLVPKILTAFYKERRCAMVEYKWVPNAVSMLRGVLSIVLFVCALRHYWLATAVIAVVAFWTAGWLAYRLRAASDLGGKFIDPANDTLLSVALVAGLFFTGIIGWSVIWFLAAMTVAIWVPIILLNDRWWRARFMNLSQYYYVAVVVLFVGIFLYGAVGRAAGGLIIPALFAGVGVSYARESRRFIL